MLQPISSVYLMLWTILRGFQFKEISWPDDVCWTWFQTNNLVLLHALAPGSMRTSWLRKGGGWKDQPVHCLGGEASKSKKPGLFDIHNHYTLPFTHLRYLVLIPGEFNILGLPVLLWRKEQKPKLVHQQNWEDLLGTVVHQFACHKP